MSPAIRNVTVVNPPPGGGTSNPQTLTIQTGTDYTPPTVALSAPVGGESWSVGSAHTITWNATDNVVVANADLDYSTNGGATFPYAIAHAIANTGSFAWTVPGTPTSTARVRVFVRDPDGNVAADSSHANLALAGWTLYASAGVNGSISPAGAIGVPDGATPTFTITPATGYSVADVLVNGLSAGAVTSYAFTNVQMNHTIAASFSLNTYTIAASAGAGGTISPSGSVSVNCGSNQSFTISPDARIRSAKALQSMQYSTNFDLRLARSHRGLAGLSAGVSDHRPDVAPDAGAGPAR